MKTANPNPIKGAVSSHILQAGSGAVQIIFDCRLRATILTELAKNASEPELECQLLFVAQEWLTLASLAEQLNPDAGLSDTEAA